MKKQIMFYKAMTTLLVIAAIFLMTFVGNDIIGVLLSLVLFASASYSNSLANDLIELTDLASMDRPE